MANSDFQLAMSDFLERIPSDFAAAGSKDEFLERIASQVHLLERQAQTTDDLYALTSALEEVFVRLGIVSATSTRTLPRQK